MSVPVQQAPGLWRTDQVDGQPAKTYSAGEVLLVPAETGSRGEERRGRKSGLAIYLVEKGEPFLVVVD